MKKTRYAMIALVLVPVMLVATVVVINSCKLDLSKQEFAISMDKEHIDQLNLCQKIADCVSGNIVTFKTAIDISKSECTIATKNNGKLLELVLLSTNDFNLANNLCSMLYKPRKISK